MNIPEMYKEKYPDVCSFEVSFHFALWWLITNFANKEKTEKNWGVLCLNKLKLKQVESSWIEEKKQKVACSTE